jgi:hypothetical protein
MDPELVARVVGQRSRYQFDRHPGHVTRFAS